MVGKGENLRHAAQQFRAFRVVVGLYLRDGNGAPVRLAGRLVTGELADVMGEARQRQQPDVRAPEGVVVLAGVHETDLQLALPRALAGVAPVATHLEDAVCNGEAVFDQRAAAVSTRDG